MDRKANASEAGRQCGYRRVRSRSIHRARSASSDRRSRITSGAAPDASYGDALPLSIENLLEFFPGSLTGGSSLGRRILQMATAIFKPEKRKPRRDVWQEFLTDTQLLKKNHVTAEELEILKDFSPLGVLIGSSDILFILKQIRWARDKKLGA